MNASPSPGLREASPLKAATTVFGLMRPHIPETTDGILTSAGICEGFAGADVSSGVLLFAEFARLVAGRRPWVPSSTPSCGPSATG